MRKFGLVLLALLAVLMLPSASSAQIGVGISVRIGPPALPVYEQPICPGPGYLWTPGYWAYGPDGYYWVPGTWVMAPAVGVLWTPGYWGWGGAGFLWHAGYWGPHVGFYGGINYGFGYTGVGFVGGRWDHGVFAYNTAVMHVNTTIIHNTYIDRTVVRNVTVNRVSYNGGNGGIEARPTRQEMVAEHEHHIEATHAQTEHEHAAAANRAFLASENHGHPAVAATSRPGEFSGHGAVGAKAGGNGFHSFTPPNHNEPALHSNNANGGHSFTPPNSSHSNNAATHNEGGNPASRPGKQPEAHESSRPAEGKASNPPHESKPARPEHPRE
jgi:WXXGXW repeat (2 copies)